jgi:hypothetical protein
MRHSPEKSFRSSSLSLKERVGLKEKTLHESHDLKAQERLL